MNSYIQITRKYLRKQKRRSILTVIGIVLSTALVTGIGTIFLSMFDAQVRYTIASSGNYYAAINQVKGDKVPLLTQNVQTEKSGIGQFVGFAAYAQNEKNDTDTPYKYLNILALDASAQKMLPYTLGAGRMPQAPGEIALDDWTLKLLNAQIGGKVTLAVGDRTLDGKLLTDTRKFAPDETFTQQYTREFTVVGTLKPPYVVTTDFASAVTFLDSAALSPAQDYTAYVKLKSVGGAVAHIKAMAAAAGVQGIESDSSPIQFNNDLLRLYAQGLSNVLNSSMIIILIVILALVILSTIAVIYNAFNISVVERVSQFGLLRCVGATPRQIRNIVFREAAILGAIGIPVGILCGTGAMGVVFAVISAIAPGFIRGGMRLIVSPWLIVLSAAVGAFTIYLSALLPARKAGKISPMEAVRGTGILKKEKFRKTDKRRLVLRILGAEGWMAWKNLGRNRRRFYITVLSMVISIVLYIVFSSLVGFAYRADAVDSGDIPNYLIYTNSHAAKLDVGPLESIEQMDGVQYALTFSQAQAEATLDPKKLNPRAAELIKQYSGTDESGKTLLYNSDLVCYQDSQLDTLIKVMRLGSLDRAAFLRGDGAIVINGAALIDRDAKKVVLTDVTTLQKGDSLNVKSNLTEDESAQVTQDLPVLAVTEEGPSGYTRNGSGGIYLIVSEKLFAQLAPATAFPQRFMVMMKPGSSHAAVKAKIDEYMKANPGLNLSDLDADAQSNKQIMTILGIFLYGFVAVISLIGCLNIINTISTNIILRTRELSVMRAIGMSDGGVRKMVALESILHGAAAALVGVLAGAALSWLLYHSMIQVREFAWIFPWKESLIAVAGAAIVAVISGFVPLRRINKGVIMEGIRGEE